MNRSLQCLAAWGLTIAGLSASTALPALANGTPSTATTTPAGASQSARARPGYFFVFGFDHGRIQIPSVMTTPLYVPNRVPQQNAAWHLRLLDAAGKELFAAQMDDPSALAQPVHSSESDRRLVARAPQLPDAVRAELLDAHGVVAWQQALDAGFVASANAATATAAAIARSAVAASVVANDSPARKSMLAAEQRRQAQYAQAIGVLNDAGSSFEQRAIAQDRIDAFPDPQAAAARNRWTNARNGNSSAPIGLPAMAAPLTSSRVVASAATLVLSGNVNITTPSSTNIASATIRAYRSADGTYVASTVADPTSGNYAMNLPAGTYDVELDLGARDLVGADKVLYLAPQRASNVVVNAASTQNFVLAPAFQTLNLSIKRSCIPYYAASVAITVARAAQVLARPALNVFWDSTVHNSDKTCTYAYALQITPGVYDFTIEATSDGVASATFSGVDLSGADQSLAFDTGTTSAWHAQLLDDTGQPIANTNLIAFDGLFHYRSYAKTDANGNFSIAILPGWFIHFPAAATGNSLPLRFTAGDLSSLPATVKLSSLALESTVNGSTTRVYSGAAGDGNRLRMLFIGDAYTNAHETFTDSNGNGVWDGVLWYDLNGNGTYDTTDIYALYGDATAPVVGTVPDANNEPFVDSNGDRFPNFDDAATFTLNTQQYVRNLLGSHYWSEHADEFQVDAAFIPSPQAGITITDDSGKNLYTSNTTFGSSMDTTRFLLSLDRTTALQVAEQLMPGFDCLVIMINEPIPAGRANETVGGAVGVQIETGGAQGVSVNSQVMGHEMGHYVGSLADEYSEFYTAPTGPPSLAGAANIAVALDPAAIPWANLLSANPPLPDLLPHPGIGVFEGADYYYGGIYRPTWTSMMRYQYDGEPFNAPSIAALDAGMLRFSQPSAQATIKLNQHGLAGSWYNPKESGQGLLIDMSPDIIAPGQGLMFAGWFTYDTTPGGEERQRWYTLQGVVTDTGANASLTIYAAYGGNFAAPPSVGVTALGTATISFTSCTEGTLAYHFNDGRGGSIPLSRILKNISCTPSGDSAGLSYDDVYAGTWYDNATSGQGLIFDVNTSQNGDNKSTQGVFAAAWYTFSADGQSAGAGASQRWYTLQGSTPAASVGNGSSLSGLAIYTATGGAFDNGTPTVTNKQVGSASIQFTDCSNAAFAYTITAGANAGKSGTIALSRLGPPPTGACR